jgi:HEAT repeats
LIGVALLGASVAGAQALEQRVASARGTVAFEFNTRSSVCGNGSSISISQDGSTGYAMNSHRSGIHIGRTFAGDMSVCESGPARVVLARSGGDVTDASTTVGGTAPHADTELGAVSPAEAASYLLAIAPRLSDRSAEAVILGAAIADGQTPWKRMLDIARDNGASDASRKASIFWVSQQAGTVATAGLRDVVMDDDANASVRSDALFQLAQRKDGEGVPALIRVVQESKSPKLRKDAIWFLSQSKDPRALDLFEKLLSGK